MAIIRQANWLSQQRVDVPDLRALESAVCNDFDLLAGSIMAGGPLVVRGFTITTTGFLGVRADTLVLSVAGGILMHFGASEAGTVFSVPSDQAAEILAATNTSVSGSFTAGTTNYIGLDITRSADDTTTDSTKFWDANSKDEITKTVPKARTLDYKIVISTQPFTVNTNVAPVAKVLTDSNNNVVSVSDARSLLFRLGSGSDNPNGANAFTWSDTDRRENPVTFSASSSTDPFAGGDKEVASLKGWMDAVMSTVWESKSGQFWYSPGARDNVKLLFGQPVLASTQDNFEWTGTVLKWDGLKVAFENSKDSAGAAVFYNTITSDLTGQALADGECLYVDIQRDSTTPNIEVGPSTPLTSLGAPTIPGSRFIIAWRIGSAVYVKDKAFEVGRALPIATTTVLGTVKLSRAPVDANNPFVITTTGGTIVSSGGLIGLDVTGNGDSPGIKGTGGSGLGPGVYGKVSGEPDGTLGFDSMPYYVGVLGVGSTSSPGASYGVYGYGGGGSGTGVYGYGGASTGGLGGSFQGGILHGNGLKATATGNGIGGEFIASAAAQTALKVTTGRADLPVIDRAGTIDIGGTVATAINISRTGITTAFLDDVSVIGGASPKNFKYATAVTRYSHVSPEVFGLTNGTLITNTAEPYVINSDVSKVIDFTARVHIPAGAVITAVHFLVINQDVGSKTIGSVVTKKVDAGLGGNYTSTDISTGACTASATGTYEWTEQGLTAGTHTVPDNGWILIRGVTAATTTANQLRIYAIRFKYEQTLVKPS